MGCVTSGGQTKAVLCEAGSWESILCIICPPSTLDEQDCSLVDWTQCESCRKELLALKDGMRLCMQSASYFALKAAIIDFFFGHALKSRLALNLIYS